MSLLDDPRVALVRDGTRYPKIPPFHPSEALPEWPEMPLSNEDNPVYRSVRRLLALLELDSRRFGRVDWNPLGDLVRPGDTVVLKPNLVLHVNAGEKPYGLTDTDSLITHGSVIRAVVDYTAKALEGRGRILIADCPVQGADWQKIQALLGIDALRAWVGEAFPGVRLDVRDFRLGRARVGADGLIVERMVDESALHEYLEVDIGRDSLLMPLMKGKFAFGVAQYPRRRMRRAHNLERNLYLFPEEILDADVVINLPKMKTHMKAGITGAMKNLVGINGHKDYLPHFRFGSPRFGGDEFPDGNWLWELLWFFAHCEWELDRGALKELFIFLSRVCAYFLPRFSGLPRYAGAVGGGSWYGNDTLWRTVLDINRAFLYFDRTARRISSEPPRRRYLALMDGLVVGHRESPLAPTPMPAGILMAAFNPLAIDAVQAAMLGFDIRRIKQVTEGFRLSALPLARFPVEAVEVLTEAGPRSIADIYRVGDHLRCEPSRGYKGYVEYRPGPAATGPAVPGTTAVGSSRSAPDVEPELPDMNAVFAGVVAPGPGEERARDPMHAGVSEEFSP